MPNQKFYAVKAGRNPGVYSSWDDCQAQVLGFPNALYRSFRDRQEAESWLGTPSSAPLPDDAPSSAPPQLTVFTDGSFLDSIPAYSYAAVIELPDGETVELSGTESNPEMLPSKNIAGETLAVRKAIEYALANGFSSMHVVCDYIGLPEWASGFWKTKTLTARLFKQAVDEARLKGLRITFEHVNGHTGVPGNERADKLAYEALMDFEG